MRPVTLVQPITRESQFKTRTETYASDTLINSGLLHIRLGRISWNIKNRSTWILTKKTEFKWNGSYNKNTEEISRLIIS